MTFPLSSGEGRIRTSAASVPISYRRHTRVDIGRPYFLCSGPVSVFRWRTPFDAIPMSCSDSPYSHFRSRCLNSPHWYCICIRHWDIVSLLTQDLTFVFHFRRRTLNGPVLPPLLFKSPTVQQTRAESRDLLFMVRVPPRGSH